MDNFKKNFLIGKCFMSTDTNSLLQSTKKLRITSPVNSQLDKFLELS